MLSNKSVCSIHKNRSNLASLRNSTLYGFRTYYSCENAEEEIKQGHVKEALQILNASIDISTYANLLQACVKAKNLSDGKLVHAHIVQRGFVPDKFLRNTLANVYAKCGISEDARNVFDEMPERDTFSWNVMISAYAAQGSTEQSLALYNQMQGHGVQPNCFTFSSVLPAFARLASLKEGMQIHEEVIRGGFQYDVFVGSALVDMYAKCSCVENARQVFDKMPRRDVVLWNAMIVGYVQNGHNEEALEIFCKMQVDGVKPDLKTFASVLPACAGLAALEQGMEIHDQIRRNRLQPDIFVQSALVDMYAKCGKLGKAQDVFDKIPQRNVVAWTAMISGCVHNGQVIRSLKLFKEMKAAGVKAEMKTFSSVLAACASLAALEQGMEIHVEIMRCGCESDIFIASALVDMYAKCGRIDKASNVFDKMAKRNAISWTAMIGGYALHGHAEKALGLFEKMQHSGINPDDVTMVCVLSACCHADRVAEGHRYFDSITRHYHIRPTTEHYGCMVDLLGRAGQLEEAQDFINKMPMKPDPPIWRSLLIACKTHKNVRLGENVAEQLFKLEPQNATNYALLSNIYAAAGRWEDIEKVRRMITDRGVVKTPGCSWIAVKKQVHSFVVGDRSHPQTDKIYEKLENFSWQMRVAGYVPDTNSVLNDLEEQKEHIFCHHHSEKLAIAFGLISTCPGTTIRVIKNLRVCGDCHSAIKFISMIATRKIIVRDASRYHNFKDGQCSCGDYW